MSPLDFLVVGHITKDLLGEGFRIGGTAAYSALAASRLGQRVGVVTAFGPDLDLASTFCGIAVHCIPSPVTTTFENINVKSKREQLVRSVGKGLAPGDIPPDWRDTPIVHLGPVAQELDPALAGCFKGALVGVTPQGWIREWDEKGRVHPGRWAKADEILPHVSVLIFSHEDIGTNRSLISNLAPRVPVLIVTQGKRGAKLHYQGHWCHVPPFPVVERDPTGAGDVFASAFLIHFAQKGDPQAAAVFASCAASLLVERGGIGGVPTLEEVENRMSDSRGQRQGKER